MLEMAENHILDDGEFEDDVYFVECGRFSLFEGLARRDEQEWMPVLDVLDRAVRIWSAKVNSGAGEDVSEAQRLLQEHLAAALALRWNAPFKEIRQRMKKLLEEAQQNGVDVPKLLFNGPTSFISRDEVVCYENDRLKELGAVQLQYEEAFVQEGRLSHIVQLLGYHPSYLSCYIKMEHFLMRGNGPLPLHIRNYVAILAASRHRCAYLVALQEKEFLRNGGDPTWLEGGIQRLPPKMLNLLTVNKLLAHQPWQVTPEHMKSLLRGADSWSVAELAHALAIMAQFHSLSSFALGCGLNPEIDTPFGHLVSGGPEISPETSIYRNPALGMGRERDNSDSEPTTDSEPLSPEGKSPPTDARTGHYMVQYYLASTTGEQTRLVDTLTEKLKTIDNDMSDEETEQERDSQFIGATSLISTDGDSAQKPISPVPIPFLLAKYIDDPNYQHEDFNASSAGTLRARDYSWEDHGFAFLNSLYPDICPLMDECFNTAFSMTYKTVGGQKNVDTSPFRQAIWYYIHSIKGIRHDDYDYKKVNQVLDIGFKTYIRLVACFPEKVTRAVFTGSSSGLEFSEKVHVNIIVVESKMQAELIYALRALMRFMK